VSPSLRTGAARSSGLRVASRHPEPSAPGRLGGGRFRAHLEL